MTFFICDAMIAIVSGGVGGTVFSSLLGLSRERQPPKS